MKALFIASDEKIFQENSAVRKRFSEYGQLFEELHVVVFSALQRSKDQIAPNVWAYSTGSQSKLRYIQDAVGVSQRVLGERKDFVISVQDPFETGLVGLILKLSRRLPLQVQVHTDFANRYFILRSFLNGVRFLMSHLTLAFADSVRVVSPRIARYMNIVPEYLTVLPIYTAMNTSGRTPPDGPTTFLTVARLEREKDLETAVRAFKEVVHGGIDARFIIVGDGSERRRLERVVQKLRLEARVKFVGWQDILAPFYESAHIYVSTSLYEGYGMSIMEAASYGLPLVISDTGLAGDTVREGEEAFICKPRDIHGFAEAMSTLALDYTMQRSMGEKAARAAKSASVSWEQYLTEFRRSIENAVRHRAKGGGVFSRNILARYFVAGITGAATQIGSLYFFTEVVGLWYLYSSIIAFVIALVLSFILQKIWTFKDYRVSKAHYQFGKYFVVAFTGVLANTILMYFLVDILGFWYIAAQVLVGAMIAVFNFLMYKFFVFKV